MKDDVEHAMNKSGTGFINNRFINIFINKSNFLIIKYLLQFIVAIVAVAA